MQAQGEPAPPEQGLTAAAAVCGSVTRVSRLGQSRVPAP